MTDKSRDSSRSDENPKKINPIVKNMYRILLNRDPDLRGLEHFTEAINNGATVGNIFEQIYNSKEYIERMKWLASKKIISGKILEYIKNKISGRVLTIVDVGAANLVNEEHIYLPLANHSFRMKVIGFEPNEYRRLERLGSTRNYELTLYPIFIGDGDKQLFHNNIPDDTSSLLPLNTKITKELDGLNALLTERIELVPTVTLDKVLVNLNIIDFLKVDIQGFELTALYHARKVLEKTLFVHCEVFFVEIYSGQPLFKDVDAFLTSCGFQFVDFFHECRYPYVNKNSFKGSDQLGWGDAVYMKKENYITDPECLLIQSLIALLIYDKVSLATALAEKFDTITGLRDFELHMKTDKQTNTTTSTI